MSHSIHKTNDIQDNEQSIKTDIDLNFDEIKYRCVMATQLSNKYSSYSLEPPPIVRQTHKELLLLMAQKNNEPNIILPESSWS